MNCVCIYVDGGKGHYIPAVTLAEQFEGLGNATKVVEFYELMNLAWMGKINKSTWRFMLKHPKWEMWVNSRNDNTKGVDAGLNYAKRYRKNHFLEWIKTEKPDCIVCTHFVPSRIMSELVQSYKLSIPVYYYATDVFSSPCSSIAPNLRKYYISTLDGAKNIVANGQPDYTVETCPFPLQKSCAQSVPQEKSVVRKALGLDDMFTIQLNLGGEGIGNVSLIKELADREVSVQIIVLGGLSEATKQRLSKLQLQLPSSVKLHVIGFVKNVDEYLIASDIIVGRAGINTMVEAMYMHRPFLITELVYTVIASAKYFEQYGIGWLALKPEEQADIVIACLQDSDFSQKMEEKFEMVPMRYDARAFAEQILSDVKKYHLETKS